MGVHAKREFNCPVDATISLIGGKYKAVILWHLKGRVLRYSELHRLIPKATDKMLAQQLPGHRQRVPVVKSPRQFFHVFTPFPLFYHT